MPVLNTVQIALQIFGSANCEFTHRSSVIAVWSALLNPQRQKCTNL